MAKANYPIDPIEQVRRGKARYCRFVDTRDELAALFVPEPTIEMLDPDGNTIAAFSRREEFASAVRNFLDGARSRHHLHNDEIDIVSERENHRDLGDGRHRRQSRSRTRSASADARLLPLSRDVGPHTRWLGHHAAGAAPHHPRNHPELKEYPHD